MTAHMLANEAAAYKRLVDALRETYGDEDEQALHDTAEGETTLHELIVRTLSASLDDDALTKAIDARVEDLHERKARIAARKDARRTAVLMAMETAGVKKIEAAEFTVSLRGTPPKVDAYDEALIPPDYWIPQDPKLDRRALANALKAGTSIPGARLGNGGVAISLRTK